MEIPEFLPYSEIESQASWSLYFISHGLVRGISRAMFGLKTYGVENIPQSGPAILAANHRHWKDVLLLPSFVPHRHVTMIARHEILEKRAQGGYFRKLGAIPVHREAPQQSEVKEILRVLKDNKLLAMFPEETREKGRTKSRSEIDLRPELKPGLARFALAANVVTIPTALVGMDRGFERPQAIGFGEPIEPPTDKNVVDKWMENWRDTMGALYHDTYIKLDQSSSVHGIDG